MYERLYNKVLSPRFRAQATRLRQAAGLPRLGRRAQHLPAAQLPSRGRGPLVELYGGCMVVKVS